MNTHHARYLLGTGLLLLVFIFPTAVKAERFQRFGDFVVHYNAIQTALLTPEIASSYGIVRSRTRALLNISVMRAGVNGPDKPVKARVDARTTTLAQQVDPIEMQEITEGEAIYYVGTLHFRDKQILDFNVEIRPAGSAQTLELTFRQQFFEE